VAAKTIAMNKRPPNRRQIWWIVALALVLAGTLFLSGRALQRHSVVAQSVPLRPNLADCPAELADQIMQAEAKARGWAHAATGLAGLSRLYHANGFYNEAMQCYQGLRQLEPGEARWLHLHASILAGFGRLDDALPLWRHAVALAPDYVPLRVHLGDSLLKANRPDAAAEAYRQAVGQDPGHPYALLGLARCAVSQNDWATARRCLKEAITLHPDFVGGLSLMVTAAEHFGDRSEADSLKAIIGRREFVDIPDPWLDGLSENCYDPYRLSVAAAVANLSGNLSAAQRLLERAIALAPGTSSYHRQLGSILFASRAGTRARQQLEKAVDLSPDDAESWILLINILTAMGETEIASQALASGLARCPQSPTLHLQRAHRLSTAGQREGAIAEFRESIRLRPSEAMPIVELAGAYFAANRTDEALAALREALSRQPEQPMALVTLTLYYIGAGDEASARAWWTHVQNQPQTSPEMVASIKQAFQQNFGQVPP
jgi:tetratricopeptide (TPR) repeat protein